MFDQFQGKIRKYGQKSSDRLVLEWKEGLALPEPWRVFMEELRSETYCRFVRSPSAPATRTTSRRPAMISRAWSGAIICGSTSGS